MTATATKAPAAGPDHRPARHARAAPPARRTGADWLILAAALAPLVVAALALIFAVGADYYPVSDIAFTELHTRDVGRGGVSVGLYSRDGWSHPGPILFYALAPFYWLTGGSSIGINLGALAINAASLTGMALIARRRAGTPLMFATVLVWSVALRTLGSEFSLDPWNLYVTVLPFGLLIFLVWAMTSGDLWALPVGALVATYLAQTHVGFVLLAIPLFALGAVWLAISVLRGDDRHCRRRLLVATGLAAVVAVLWVPPLIEELTHDNGNLSEIADWFEEAEGGLHTPADGVQVMTGQLELAPEWVVNKRPFTFAGESPFLDYVPIPWLLVPVIAAGFFLWRRRQDCARQLLVVLATATVLGIVAVWRTVGPAFDYRLRWSWVPAMLALAIVAWAAWLVASHYGPTARKLVAGVGVVVLTGVTAVNLFTAATTGVPYPGQTRAMRALTPQVLDALGEVDGPVLVTNRFQNGAYFSRGMVLQLERRGIEAVVPPRFAEEFGEHRVYRGGPLAARLLVVENQFVEQYKQDPDLQLVAEWNGVDEQARRQYEADVAALEQGTTEDPVSQVAFIDAKHRLDDAILGEADSDIAYRVAFFLEDPGSPIDRE